MEMTYPSPPGGRIASLGKDDSGSKYINSSGRFVAFAVSSVVTLSNLEA
jgi:hypothetical protein